MPLALDRHKYVVTDEFTRLLDAARSRRHKHSQRDYALLAIAGLTGLRPVELTGVTLGDLHLDETPAWLAVRTAKQRGGARDTVILPPTAVQALRTYAETLPTTEPDSRVFHMTTRQAGRLFRFYAPAGVPSRSKLPKGSFFRSQPSRLPRPCQGLAAKGSRPKP